MRHRVKGRKLKRTTSHRTALLRSLATSLLKHKRIKTTLAKAKETRSFVEKLITKARKGDLHSKRLVASEIKDKEVLKELFSEIVNTVGDRPGGYTRVVKLGTRLGDSAQMAILELVDYNEAANKKAEERKALKEQKQKYKSKKESQKTTEEQQLNQ
jgi:large subunit ribosomal protein L17